MTPEELREKVAEAIGEAGADWLVSSEPNELISHKTADAAIRVVLEAALNAPTLDMGANDEWCSGHSTGVEDKCEAIRALLPQDKDTGSSAPVADRRD